ncbi:MAG TPA: universal stress protein, partial [Gemmatimonadales bacterium]|nr:universal stress protein [Gemmatimonadales bacterium]
PNEREGAVIEGVVRRARVPCLVVPRGHCTFRRVLAAVDGGPDSEDVMTVARHIACLFEAPVRAIHVEAAVPVSVGASSWEPEPLAGDDRVVCHGDPVAEILRVVRDEDVGLLVFGHHRGGPVSTHATSGVAPRLLQRARGAVLTVPI